MSFYSQRRVELLEEHSESFRYRSSENVSVYSQDWSVYQKGLRVAQERPTIISFPYKKSYDPEGTVINVVMLRL